MKALKNPVVAILLSAVLIIASTLISVNLKLGAKAEKVTDGFYSGVSGQESISSQLHSIMDSASELITIANNYELPEGMAEELQTQIDVLRSAMSVSRDDISSICAHCQVLVSGISSLGDALSRQSLAERDQSSLEEILSDVAAARQRIESSGYNESVRELYRKYDRFPATILAPLAGVSFPAYFA